LLKQLGGLQFASPPQLGRQYNLNRLLRQKFGNLDAVRSSPFAHIVRDNP
jgi:hypothetical protein